MMKRLAAIALLPLWITTARADDLQPPSAAPPVATPAPQNEDWSNVSHINGVPVKVGERGDYLYRFRKTNVMANPFGPFWGYYDGSASYAVSQNVAVSVGLSGWSTGNGYHTGYQATASLPIYFRRTYSGPYLEPGLITRSTSSSYSNYCASSSGCGSSGDTHTWVGPELLLGWQWSFDSGLNLAMAFGVAKHVGDSQMSPYSSHDQDANGYFRVGYAF
jgi:hypothetical protein